MLLDLTGILFNTEHSDIFYIVVVVVVTLLALAVLCLIEMTESRVSNEAIFKLDDLLDSLKVRTQLKLLRKSIKRPTIDIESFFDDATTLIQSNGN